MASLLTLSAAPYQSQNTDLANIAMQGLQISEDRFKSRDALAQEAYKLMESSRQFNAEMTVKKAEMGLKEREMERLEDAQQFNEMMDVAKFEESKSQFDTQTDLAQAGLDLQQYNADTNRMGTNLEVEKWNDPYAANMRKNQSTISDIQVQNAPATAALGIGNAAADITLKAANTKKAEAYVPGGIGTTASASAQLSRNTQVLLQESNERLQSLSETLNKVKESKTFEAGLNTEDPKQRAELFKKAFEDAKVPESDIAEEYFQERKKYQGYNKALEGASLLPPVTAGSPGAPAGAIPASRVNPSDTNSLNNIISRGTSQEIATPGSSFSIQSPAPIITPFAQPPSGSPDIPVIPDIYDTNLFRGSN